MIAAGYTGAAVAIQPSTGQILAMVTTPSYDPNGLASHDSQTQLNTWTAAKPSSPNSPLLDQAVQAAYQPGSTFKLIVATAALTNGVDAENTDDLPDSPAITLPGTNTTLHNFDNETCPGGSGNGLVSMKDAIAHSCNTAFATLAGKVGEGALRGAGAEVRLRHQMSIPLTVATSCLGPASGGNCMNILRRTPGLYQSGIGQRNVQDDAVAERDGRRDDRQRRRGDAAAAGEGRSWRRTSPPSQGFTPQVLEPERHRPSRPRAS